MPYLFTASLSYLLNRIGVRLSERFTSQLADHGVGLPTYRVLATLRQHDAQTLGDLQELVSIEMSTLSRLISQLVKQGLLSRVRPEEDARTVRIDLTAKGAALADTLMAMGASFERDVLAGLSDGDVEALKVQLRRISGNIAAL